MTTLENDLLKVSVRSRGAELTAVYNKVNQTQHLWQANPAIWAWHAPTLFPVIGECIDNSILVNSETYKMGRHGFARNLDFTLLHATSAHALFCLPFSQGTLVTYPYKFEFQIAYKLTGNRLSVTYQVINKDDKPIYFSVGGHPAFNVPFSIKENYADYYLEFTDDTRLTRHLLSESGLFNGKTESVMLKEKKLYLTKDLFAKDALVFKDLRSRKVSLRSTKHNQSISLEFHDFTYLGIWAKPGADFVCIEPWLGCADTEGKRVDIAEKEAIQKVSTGKSFEATYTIEINS